MQLTEWILFSEFHMESCGIFHCAKFFTHISSHNESCLSKTNLALYPQSKFCKTRLILVYSYSTSLWNFSLQLNYNDIQRKQMLDWPVFCLWNKLFLQVHRTCHTCCTCGWTWSTVLLLILGAAKANFPLRGYFYWCVQSPQATCMCHRSYAMPP